MSAGFIEVLQKRSAVLFFYKERGKALFFHRKFYLAGNITARTLYQVSSLVLPDSTTNHAYYLTSFDNKQIESFVLRF